ncbi:MAG: hypothetical protein AAGK97_07550, partial [Bacteroidota bacterium]
YDQTGTFIENPSNPNGCDSTVTIHLTVLEDIVQNLNATICDGDSYDWEGSTYTTQGRYTSTYTASSGCDSILTLTLVVLPSNDPLCANGTLCDLDVEITNQSQNVDYRVSASHPFDGTMNAYVNVQPNDTRVSVTTRFYYEVNYGAGWDTIEVADLVNQNSRRTYSSSANLTGPNGFYNSVRVYNSQTNAPITIPLSPTNAQLSGCAGTVGPNELLNSSPTYNAALETVIENFLCLSGWTNGVNYEMSVVGGGQSIGFVTSHTPTGVWIGINKDDALITYSESGGPIVPRTNVGAGTGAANTSFSRNPCNTTNIFTRVTGIISNNTNYNYYDVPISGPFIITGGSPTTTCVENTLTATLIGNCQSDVNYLWTTSDGTILSDPTNQTISIGGDGVYTVEVTCEGCPPVTQTFCLPPLLPTDLTETICDGDTIFIGDNPYTMTGMFSDTIAANNGCDSIINLDLTVLSTTIIDTIVEICEGETFNGYDQTGMYSDTLTASNGCDSIINLDLTVNTIVTTDLIEVICQGDSIVIGDSTFDMTGMYQVILIDQNDCDSIVNLDLTVSDPPSSTFNETICQGQVFTFNGVDYDSPGMYTDTITTSDGCDSIVTLNLAVLAITYGYVSETICEGETYTNSGNTYDATGTYQIDLTGDNGCDSILIITLYVQPISNDTLNATICSGDSFDFEGQSYNIGGTYTIPLQDQLGCDSLRTLVLNVLPANDPIC